MQPSWDIECSWWDSEKRSQLSTQIPDPQKLWYNKCMRKKDIKKSLVGFACGIQKACLLLTEKAIEIFLPLPTTYLCEAGFSLYISNKTTHYKSIHEKAHLKIELSNNQSSRRLAKKTLLCATLLTTLFLFWKIVTIHDHKWFCYRLTIILNQLNIF